MVGGLRLGDGNQPVADVDDTGILSRAADDLLPFSRELLEIDLGAFVGAVLAPHDRKDPQLDPIRLPAEDLDDMPVFLRRQAMLLNDFRIHIYLLTPPSAPLSCIIQERGWGG